MLLHMLMSKIQDQFGPHATQFLADVMIDLVSMVELAMKDGTDTSVTVQKQVFLEQHVAEELLLLNLLETIL